MPTTTIARGVRTVRDVACWWCRAVQYCRDLVKCVVYVVAVTVTVGVAVITTGDRGRRK